MNKFDAVLIAGPTASGKSAAALALAEHSDGVVINADSMQVYRDLRVLTARPSPADEAAAPHRLYGHVAAADGYTVARWLTDVRAVLTEAAQAGRTAVIVGGTGLYFTALTEGLSDVPPIPEAVRARWRVRQTQEPAAALHAELARIDPAMAARLRPTDAQRVVRALEVREATGRSLAAFQAEKAAPLVPRPADRIVIAPARDRLHARIADRFRRMVDDGGLAEARAFAALGLDPALPAMKAIGVPEMIAAATGARPLEAAIEAAVAATRGYAKRQETWFRNRFSDWRRVSGPDDPAVSA